MLIMRGLRYSAGLRAFLAAFAAVAVSTAVLAQDAPAIKVAATERYEFRNLSPLVVADIIHNEADTPEIVLTDSEGRIRLLDGKTLKEIRSVVTVPPTGLTAASVGDFLGRNRQDIAVGTDDGRVIFFEGSTLKPLAQISVGPEARIVVQPTAVPVRRGSLKNVGVEDLLPESSDLDLCVVPDERGMLHAFYVTGGATPEEGYRVETVWTEQTSAGFAGPPSIGTVRSKRKLDLVAGSRDGRVLLIDPLSGKSEEATIKELGRIFGSPLLADLRGADGLAEIVVTFENGEVQAMEYAAGQTPLLRPIGRVDTGTKPLQGALLATQLGTTLNRVVLQGSDSRLVALAAEPGIPWLKIGEDTRALPEKKTEVALIPSYDGVPDIVVATGRSVVVTTNMRSWVSSGGTTPLATIDKTLDEDLSGVIGLYASPDNKTLNIVAATVTSALIRFELPMTLPAWPTRTLWETSGGSCWHTSMNDPDYAKLRARRAADAFVQVTAKQNELGEARLSGNWDRALELAKWLQDFDPTNTKFVELQRNTWIRKYLLSLVAGIGAGLALIGFVSFKAWQIFSRAQMKRRAGAKVQAGDYAGARVLYEKLYHILPNDPKIFVPLAHVYMAEANFSAAALPVLGRTWELSPDNKQLLHAYTRALLLKPETNAAAEKVYHEAITTFPEPQLIEYGLGACYLAKDDYEQAAKRLRAAIRGGLTTDEVFGALTDVYLRTKTFTAKALPVFEQQFAKRQESQEFVEGYLLACIDARKTDAQVETLCHQVLEGNSTFSPAYCHLCAIHLQKGQVGQAIDDARAALKYSPGDRQGVALLAHCFLIQSRKDDEALQAFLNALKNEPEEPELLRTVSEIYYSRGVYDAAAVDIYKRSLAVNPNDLTTLQALAQAALLTGDDQLTIRTVEGLQQLGQTNAKLIRQLAQAFVRSKNRSPRVEKILREAMRAEPKNVEYLAELAHVLQLQDRVDSEAVPVYEAHMAADPSDIVIGRQLARAYIGMNRFENALSIVQRLQEIAPADEELKRLIALASLYGNKIDEAIAGYQRILSINPDDEDALVNLALGYAQKRHVDDESARLYARAHAIRPEAEGIALALARCTLAKNDALKAVEWFQKALKARPGVEELVVAHVSDALTEFPDALRVRWFLCELFVGYNRLREAMEQLLFIFETNPGQAKNVLSALDKILAKDPNNITALIQKGRMLLASDGAKQARRSLEKAMQLQPTNAEVQKSLVLTYEKILEEKEEVEIRFNLGKLHYQMLEFDRAIGCFQKTATDYRWEAESVKALGKCFTAKGMLDLALQEYKKLVVDEETKELLYDLAQRYEAKKDLVGAKTVYRQLFAADIDYKDVRSRFEMLSGSTSDPMAFEKTNIVQQMSEEASRRYELLDELGRGAMGIVYRARDKELEEVVALKILPDSMSNNPEAVRRFKIEARNARRISHPHIVRIHDIGEEMGRKYISMEYVDGSDLKKRVKGGPKMSLKEVYHFGIQIADALAYAHRLGIVHRDIKPANIMLTSSNDVKVTDFGIAKLMDQTAEGTMAGAVIGTPLYMSPEQVQGIPVDARADLYSFGVMLYEFVATRPPFTEGDLAYQHMHREPDPIADCPEPLWAIIRKCLAKAKDDRFQSGEEIVQALRSTRDQVLALGD